MDNTLTPQLTVQQLKEEWRLIPGCLNYEASNLGKIRSIDKVVNHNYGGLAIKKGKLLKMYIDTKGYYSTGVILEGKARTISVHRLIALAFIPNPENKPQVNHINGIKTDNNVLNLEWVTSSENVQHAWDTGLCSPHKTKVIVREYARKKVKAINIHTNEDLIYSSIGECCKDLKSFHSNISQAIRRGSVVNKTFKIEFV